MLSKERLIKLYKTSPKGLYQKIKYSHRELFDIISSFEGSTFSEKAFRYCYPDKTFQCKNVTCKKSATFKSFKKGFNKFCSKTCSNNAESTKKKKRKTNIERYGHEHALQSENVKKKQKETFRKKYGGHPLTQQNIKEKQAKTNLKKYGVKNVSKVESFIEKRRDTYKSTYGVSHPMKTDEVKKRFSKSMVERYGVDHPMKSISIKEKHLKSVQNAAKEKKNLFYEELKETLSGDFELLFNKEDYTGVHGPSYYPFKCKTCKTEFEDYLIGCGLVRCPSCYPKGGTSKAEKEIVEYISSIYDGDIKENNRNILSSNKELDIYIPEKNIAIEFDGLYYHSEFFGKKDKWYHLNKTNECEEENIQLIHIFEDEWTAKQNRVKDRLSYILSDKSHKRIYARKCSIKQIPTKRKQEFLEKNHLDGAGYSNVKLGLFHNNDLISVMTFGTPSVAQNNHSEEEKTFELKRFASTCSVVGGTSKLLSYFERRYDPKKIITYADRRWSTRPTVYDKIGFDYAGSSDPGYWYVKNGKRYHRYSFRKHALNEKLETFDENKTEVENMIDNGFDRIWDCGQHKYEKHYI